MIQDTGKFVVKEDITFSNPDTGEVIEFYAGDTLRMWRTA